MSQTKKFGVWKEHNAKNTPLLSNKERILAIIIFILAIIVIIIFFTIVMPKIHTLPAPNIFNNASKGDYW